MPGKNKFVKPGKLEKGDVVGVVAPSGKVDRKELEKGLAVIEKMGFQPVLGKHIFSKNRYLAGTDKQRARDLMSMFEDPGIKGIFCARGGYGVNRILHLLDAKVIRKNPKVLVGSSDITLLLIFLLQKCFMVSFHGPMIAGSFGRLPMKKSQKQLCETLSGKREGKLTARTAKVVKSGTAKGKLTGGNLTLLCRSLQTGYEINADGKILLIEDVNEAPYKIDGMLWQLKEAGKFKKVRGVVFGEMINCRPPNGQTGKVEDIIREFFRDASFPVIMNCPIAHGKEIWTLPFGVEAQLDTKTKSLTPSHPGVL